MDNLITVYSSFEVACSCPAAAAGAVIVQLVPPQSDALAGQSMQMGLVSLTVQSTTAVASLLALVKADQGVIGTPTAPGTFFGASRLISQGGGGFPAIPSNLNTGALVNAWTVPPTQPGTFNALGVLPGTLGASVVWTWPEDNPYTANLAQLEPILGPPAKQGGVLLVNADVVVCAALAVTARWIQYRLRDNS